MMISTQVVTLFVGLITPNDAPTQLEVEQALRKAVEFFHWEVSSHGGYVWRYSADLTYRRGEAVVGPTTIWVQPPGTPTVGLAMLEAYEATHDPYHLDAARDAGYALCKGQRRSGGWHYSIEFDPTKRPEFDYRDNPRPVTKGRSSRQTILDDDTTQAALRFLMRLDEALELNDSKIHDAVTYGLQALRNAQYPNGGYYVWWLEFPEPPSSDDFPVLAASYPSDWPRTWQNDWTGRYVTNDDLIADVIDTFLLAYQTYDDPKDLNTAKRCGDFLILAQMPEPQPAWAQQYDVAMQPAWARKFEPPAISGYESQTILNALMNLYEVTQDAKYLEPIPKAIDYLRRSQIDDGQLARFYELETNRPLYFTTDYQLTYQPDDLPTHYGFVVSSRLDRLENRYQTLQQGELTVTSPDQPELTPKLLQQVRNLLDTMDKRGVWLGRARNGTAIIESRTFANNVSRLAQFLALSNNANP